jgi:5,10-methylenetetrahydromethanopterin reductase
MAGAEFSVPGFCPPFTGADYASGSEALGFDVQMFGENHINSADIFSEMRAAATTTSTIRLLAGPVNFMTRDPGVIASAVAAVQVASGGRAICGIARGDSAVAMAGKRPQREAELSRDLSLLQTYLRRDSVDFGGRTSALDWIGDFPYERVPVEMVCSGPRSIALAAARTDRVGLSVGANPERIRWALDIISTALSEAGLQRSDVRVGAYVPIALAADRASGRDALRSRVAGWAHMSSFPGHDLSVQPPNMRRVTEQLRHGYDYRFHRPGVPAENPNTAMIDAEFADWFGIGGPPSYVVDRLIELAEMGVDYFGITLRPDEREPFASDVLQPVKEATSTRDTIAP